MPHHCHDEHCADGHDHSSDITPAVQTHLYEQIDFDGVRALNETMSGSARAILKKTWAQRLDEHPEVESDADEQVIIHIPSVLRLAQRNMLLTLPCSFAGQVRLHSLHIRTSASLSAPMTLRVFSNNEVLDFDSATSTNATQTFTLSQTSEVQEIPVKRALFNSCRHLALFFEDNFSQQTGNDEDVTRFSYLGFKGDFMKLNREPVDVLYEAAANPSDHKVQGASNELGARQNF